MAQLARDLKKGFLHMIETITICKTASGSQDGKEPKLKSVKKISVQGRGIRMKPARPPKRPGVNKGGPSQTN